MKTKYILILSSITLLLFNFTKNKSQEKYTPPGTVKVGTYFFMDEAEISNMAWMEYVYWTERVYGKNSDQYSGVQVDSNVWDEPFRSHYFSHPAYRTYPVVGISYEQATAYCKWRSDRVMEQLLLKKAQKKNIIIPSKVTYRLPTREEWEKVAKMPYSDKTQKVLDSKYKGANKANFYSVEKTEEAMITTAPVLSYWPNEIGVYNMRGNVSELVVERGIVKGGSWTDQESHIQIETEIPYTKPSKSIGFRCVCEVSFEESDS
ncbi:MAG: formylglycine-generating enzyme family protein [Salibacteraceae bacterium]